MSGAQDAGRELVGRFDSADELVANLVEPDDRPLVIELKTT